MSPYQPAGRFFARFPILPKETLGHVFPQTPLTQILTPIFLDMLDTASPSLATQLRRHLKGHPETLWSDLPVGLKRSVIKYLSRASARSTPYGALSGIGEVHLGEEGSTLQVASPDRHKTVTRLSQSALRALVHKVLGNIHIRESEKLFLNSAAYSAGGRVWLPISAGFESVSGVQSRSVRHTRLTQYLLREVSWPISWRDLRAQVALHLNRAESEIDPTFEELLRIGFFVPELLPPSYCPDSLAHMIRHLRAYPTDTEGLNGALDICLSTQKLASDYDQSPIGSKAAAFSNLREWLATQLGNLDQPLNIDTLASVEGHLSPQLTETVQASVQHLLEMTPQMVYPKHLRDYVDRFTERYGSDRNVSVLEVLDPVAGLGLPDNYRQAETPGIENADLKKREVLLLEWVSEVLKKGEQVLHLTAEQVQRLKFPKADLGQGSFDFMVRVHNDEGLVDCSDAMFAGSAGRSLGRFAHVLERPFVLASEEAADATSPLFVNLTFALPDARVANVGLAAIGAPYHLAINEPVSPDHVSIDIKDILVGVQGGQLYLQWGKTGQKLLVSCNHMMNPRLMPDLCRFLLDVSILEPICWPFSWGEVVKQFFLPRLQFENMVFSLAKWRLGPVWSDALEKSDAAVVEWRQTWNVPSWVYLVYADNRLLLNLDLPEHRDVFRTEWLAQQKRGVALVVEEHLGAAFELVVPQKGTVEQKAIPFHVQGESKLEAEVRTSGLAQDWIYFKLYTPATRHNDLLLVLSPTLNELKGEPWFFIRYADPKEHIRLRLYRQESAGRFEALEKLDTALFRLFKGALIQDYQMHRYDREIERYGGVEGLKACEAFFWKDSEHALFAAEQAGKRPLSDDLMAAISASAVLNAFFGGDFAGIQGLLKRIRAYYESKDFKDESDYFRKARPQLWPWMFEKVEQGREEAVLTPLSAAAAELRVQLTHWREQEVLSSAPEEVLSSVLHMHFNRRGLNRVEEYRAIYTLERMYDSFLGRQRTQSKTKQTV
ncbi:MAG: lantibiotic dehydratase [Deinococcaceae bacterium]